MYYIPLNILVFQLYVFKDLCISESDREKKRKNCIFVEKNNKMMRWIQSNILFLFLGVPDIE